MHRPLLLRGARQVLTLRGSAGLRRGQACRDLGIISDGSVLIHDGKIRSVGQSRRIDNLAEARGALVVDVHGTVVMPGFVDANAALPANAALARRLFHLAFSHGTTTLAGRAAYSTLRALPAPGLALIPTLEIEPGFDYGQITRAAHRQIARALRINLLAHTRQDLRALQALAIPVRAHAAPDANPDWLGLALAYGSAAVELNHPIDAFQAALLADSPAAAILTPASCRPARHLLDSGVGLALGSGHVASHPGTCSMQTAALLAVRDKNLDLAEAITLATINAAHALGIAADCGSIEAGKTASLLVLHISDYRDLPCFFGVNVVSKIFQTGNLVTWPVADPSSNV